MKHIHELICSNKKAFWYGILLLSLLYFQIEEHLRGVGSCLIDNEPHSFSGVVIVNEKLSGYRVKSELGNARVIF